LSGPGQKKAALRSRGWIRLANIRQSYRIASGFVRVLALGVLIALFIVH
jgi:23S rRNA U2552 (ribose-2'-O)-methylase RlmE/FtsJ